MKRTFYVELDDSLTSRLVSLSERRERLPADLVYHAVQEFLAREEAEARGWPSADVERLHQLDNGVAVDGAVPSPRACGTETITT
ncbi:MAG: hypothetical protein AAFX81_10925 [Pseudomonadota bacterium]